MGYKTERSKVQGLGAAGEGVGHWWAQRLTSLALIPLTILFIFPYADAVGRDYLEVRALYSRPLPALIAILFLGVTFRHLQQGLQVVIEDYVHAEPTRTGLIIGNTLLCWALGLTGIFAIAKIAFAA